MGKGASLALILVGVLMIYLGVFGLTFFGQAMFEVGGTLPYRNDCDDGAGWTSLQFGSRVNPAGFYELTASIQHDWGGQTVYEGKAYSPFSILASTPQYTLEVKASLDASGSTNDCFVVQVDGVSGSYVRYSLNVMETKIEFNKFADIGTGGVPLSNNLGTYYVWTILVDNDAGTMDVYRDGQLVAQGKTPSTGQTMTYVAFRVWGWSQQSAVAHIDYFEITEGLNPPGTGPGPGTGQLVVVAEEDLDEDGVWNPIAGLDIRVEKDGAYYNTYTTDANGEVSDSVPPGSYSASATYQGISESNVGTVSEGAQTTIHLYFSPGGTTPPPDWVEQLKQFFADPLVQTGNLIGGTLLTGVGVITLAFGKKKRYPIYPL